MKMIFDRNGEGRQELVAALGMISDSLDYSKWKPVLPLAARQLTCIIGADVFSEIVDLYRTDDLDPEREAPEPTLSENIIKLQIIDNHILSTMQSKSKSF